MEGRLAVGWVDGEREGGCVGWMGLWKVENEWKGGWVGGCAFGRWKEKGRLAVGWVESNREGA